MDFRKLLMIGLVLITFSVTSALAVEGGNPRKGKYLFKKNCKACHTSNSEVGAVTPLSKTMAQWDRMFEKNNHPGDAWQDFSEQDLLDINHFLYDHAIDSDQPETCG